MEPIECRKCGKLFGYVGQRIVSGVVAVEITCYRCRNKNLVTVEVA